jgi:hypothetical protein
MIHGSVERGSRADGPSGRNSPGSEPGVLIEAIVHPPSGKAVAPTHPRFFTPL